MAVLQGLRQTSQEQMGQKAMKSEPQTRTPPWSFKDFYQRASFEMFRDLASESLSMLSVLHDESMP